MDGLEHELQRKLDRARSANLVERIERGYRPGAEQSVVQHAGGNSKRRVGEVQRVSCQRELRTVHHIENIGPELQRHRFVDGELPPQRQIELVPAKAPQRVARQIPLYAGNGSRECSLVEAKPSRTSCDSISGGAIGAVKEERLARNNVGAFADRNVWKKLRKVDCRCNDVCRRSGAGAENEIGSPSAQQITDHSLP